MKFNVLHTEHYSTDVQLLYRANEYSIDIHSDNKVQISTGRTILINDIQLEIDNDNTILYLWGYCPLINAQRINLEIPQFSIGKLWIELDEQLSVGFPVRYNSELWKIYKSKNDAWFCIGSPKIPKEYTAIEFCQNCIAIIEDGKLVSLYLKPIII